MRAIKIKIMDVRRTETQRRCGVVNMSDLIHRTYDDGSAEGGRSRYMGLSRLIAAHRSSLWSVFWVWLEWDG
ncbi:hypothetical protein BDN70DRAFT_610732 [Pholiota conissans]|uniref:Uncharacterized protein n=1 Tax=Pholiota conissans TaxID=109636 RepID=A0A9P5YM24_9AGAR|nr:hypothetical protein BDN70DRAFT_610732 [Pholiota conissans]